MKQEDFKVGQRVRLQFRNCTNGNTWKGTIKSLWRGYAFVLVDGSRIGNNIVNYDEIISVI